VLGPDAARIPLPSAISAHGDQGLMRNAAISWHFERDPIPYALDTDWLVGAAGFELPHFRIGIRHSNLALICGRFSRASQRDAAGVHLFTAFELAHLDGGWPGSPCWRATNGRHQIRACATMSAADLIPRCGSSSPACRFWNAEVRILPPQPASQSLTRPRFPVLEHAARRSAVLARV
jgi:hypothetical protein